ncbi:MAG TPA: hypothetical protein VK698_22805 [Kofleriaceae bacterium]|nr:hypothetical protein [Kofleriaceae bacterium]
MAGAAAVFLCCTAWPAPALADGAAMPSMDPSRPVLCIDAASPDGQRWRVQCDENSKTCLWSPDGEVDRSGVVKRDLERARSCTPAPASYLTERKTGGYQLVRALPDAPYGWERDERGRVYQVNFDLKRRLYLGAAWAPSRVAGETEAGRTTFDFGLLVWEHLRRSRSPTRHRLRLVEGEARLAPYSASLVLAHYDVSRHYDNPLVRITTFFGRPRRSDLTLHLGTWVEAGGLELHGEDQGNARLWKVATGHLTIDLWQSADLESYARARAGVGFEGASQDGLGDRSAVTPGGALESELTLDKRGFHHLGAEIEHERPRYIEGSEGTAERTRARVHYEVIVIALNDQPLSLRLSAGAEKRDDIPGLADRWALTAQAGLRFSLWAPPRAQ